MDWRFSILWPYLLYPGMSRGKYSDDWLFILTCSSQVVTQKTDTIIKKPTPSSVCPNDKHDLKARRLSKLSFNHTWILIWIIEVVVCLILCIIIHKFCKHGICMRLYCLFSMDDDKICFCFCHHLWYVVLDLNDSFAVHIMLNGKNR